MSTSEIEYRGRSFGAHDAMLRVWLKLLVDDLASLASAPEWVEAVRADWEDQATTDFDFGVVLNLDETLGDVERKNLVLASSRRAYERLRAMGNPIPAETLNAVGSGNPDIPFPQPLPAEPFHDIAWHFMDLLAGEEDEGDGPWCRTAGEVQLALDAHVRWLADPAWGARLKVKDAILEGLNLEARELTRSRFLRVDLARANLSNARLTRSDLSEVNLQGGVLDGADLTGADLDRCNLDGVSARRAVADSARIHATTFARADLTEVSLHATAFSRVEMPRAQLRGSTMSAAWNGADLTGCDFGLSDIRDTHFRDADMRDANFEGAVLIRDTFRKCRIHGVRGVPFLVEGIGGAMLDLGPSGDGRPVGSAEDLRSLLGGTPGVGPHGTGTGLDQYRAFEVHELDTKRYSVERRKEGTEVLDVPEPSLVERRLMIRYRIKDPRFGEELACGLIFRLVIGELLNDVFRGRADDICFENLEVGKRRVWTYADCTTAFASLT